MAAVFLIVSRKSGKALMRTGYAGTPVVQSTQDNQKSDQLWTLEHSGAGAGDFLIHPLNSPGLAITVNPGFNPTQPAPLDLEANGTAEQV
jgi:hypothetical protein